MSTSAIAGLNGKLNIGGNTIGELTVDITASGTLGLDTGSEVVNTFYYVYLIGDTSDSTNVGAMLSTTNGASPTMPSSFESQAGFSALAGNFDGAGMSFGVLQFNAKSGTLQPILRQCLQHMPQTMHTIFTLAGVAELTQALQTNTSFFQWALTLNTTQKRIRQPWQRRFATLGETEGCQKFQMLAGQPYVRRAQRMMQAYGFTSERAYCLCFDIAVQNGSVVKKAREHYRTHNRSFYSERTRLFLLAQAVGYGAYTRWVNDVLSRKLCIAGHGGTVHGKHYATLPLNDTPANFHTT